MDIVYLMDKLNADIWAEGIKIRAMFLLDSLEAFRVVYERRLVDHTSGRVIESLSAINEFKLPQTADDLPKIIATLKAGAIQLV
jgi:putative heme iron utilization protein